MSTLTENLTALARRSPALAAALRTTQGSGVSVCAARNGMATAVAEGRYLHSAYDPWQEAVAWAAAQAARWQAGEVAVVLGTGLLYQAEALCAQLPREARLALVVPDLGLLREACAARRLGNWLDRVDWVWGSDDEMVATLAGHGAPLRLMRYEPAIRSHEARYARLEGALGRGLAGRAGGQLHVAVVGPIYGGSLPIARYAVEALGALGHRVTWIDHSPHDPSYRLLSAVQEPRQRLTVQARFADLLSLHTLARLTEDPPDLLLALAQAPLTLPVLELLRRKKFLTAMWFVENHRHLTYWQQVAGGYDHWFVFQKGPCLDALRRAGARGVSYLPLAADPAVHRPLDLTPEEHAEFGADVSFVGAGYANRRALFPRLITPAWSFKLWGNEWDGASAVAPVLQRAGARVETETCVKIFNATKVNVNVHSWTGTGTDPHPDSVNPRTFELAACGAFQLVDQRELLPELFEPDELATFTGPDDLEARIRSWLQEPAAREAVAQAGRRRVLAQHTYRHRMADLLGQLGVLHPDRIGALLRGDRQAERLAARSTGAPELLPLLQEFSPTQRVELKDVAAQIRGRGPDAQLAREELLLLMLDEYRMEARDLV